MKIRVQTRVTFRDNSAPIKAEHEVDCTDFPDLMDKIQAHDPMYKLEYVWDDWAVEISSAAYNSFKEDDCIFAFFTCIEVVTNVHVTLMGSNLSPVNTVLTEITHTSLADLKNKLQEIYPNGKNLQMHFQVSAKDSIRVTDKSYDYLLKDEPIFAVLFDSQPVRSGWRQPELERLSGRLDQLLKIVR